MSRANEFQKEVGTLLKRTFVITNRLDDTSSNRFGNFQVSQKPFDYFGATSNGKFWGAEVKRIKSIRFPIVNIAKHQRQALILLEDNFCHAWLFINWRLGGSGKAIWIPLSDYAEVEYLAICAKRRSLKASDFDSKWLLERSKSGWIIPDKHPLKVLV